MEQRPESPATAGRAERENAAPRPPLSEFMGRLPELRATSGDRHEALRSQRGRLMAALVELAAEHGYEEVSILDIVSRAGTSKRAFYKHFKDKEECLVRSFDLVESYLVQSVVLALEGVDDHAERISAGMRAFLRALAEAPDFTRLFLNETSAHSPHLAARWARALETFGRVMERRREAIRETDPDLPPLPAMQVMAATAGINELVRIKVFREGVESLEAAADDLAALAVIMFEARRRPGRGL